MYTTQALLSLLIVEDYLAFIKVNCKSNSFLPLSELQTKEDDFCKNFKHLDQKIINTFSQEFLFG